jgi:hypothetical protein
MGSLFCQLRQAALAVRMKEVSGKAWMEKRTVPSFRVRTPIGSTEIFDLVVFVAHADGIAGIS